MASKTIMWGDGTSDKITVTYSGAVGRSELIVLSDQNHTFSSRKISIKLKINGATTDVISVSQKALGNAFSVAYSEAYN